MAQLTLENLSVGYGTNTVVSNISLTVQGGDFVCVIGNNGSGKTTLMKTVLGLIPPVSGTVILGDGLKRDEIGYMPQLSSAQRDFPASVGEIVLSGCAGRCGIRPFYSRAEKAMAQAAMEKIGIADLKKRCYRELSGGQQQRVLIARALCATKKLMILDEPASGLDAFAARDMYSLIRDINRDGITVMMILHDISAAVSYASKILSIGDGIFYGTPDEYRQSQGVLRCE